MKIAQVLPNLSTHDAIGNNVMLWRDCLTAIGHENAIFAGHADSDFSGVARDRSELAKWAPTHVLYHFSTYDPWIESMRRLHACPKVMIYHNVTPATYFMGFSDVHVEYAEKARAQLRTVKRDFEMAWADSNYNSQELHEAGFSRIRVLPLAIPYVTSMNGKPTVSKYGSAFNKDTLTVLYVGRISPSKRITDVIMAFHYIKKLVTKTARLILIGSWGGFESYKEILDCVLEEFEIEDVYFLGETSDDIRDTLYKVSTVLVTASEHEGFCVPIVEAWMAGLPVVAVDAAALPETVGEAGVLCPVGRPEVLGEAIVAAWEDRELWEDLRRRGYERAKLFQVQRFLEDVRGLLKEVNISEE